MVIGTQHSVVLQALCTWITCEGIEKCRLACGGHGYSLLSGLPSIYASYVQVRQTCMAEMHGV